MRIELINGFSVTDDITGQLHSATLKQEITGDSCSVEYLLDALKRNNVSDAINSAVSDIVRKGGFQ